MNPWKNLLRQEVRQKLALPPTLLAVVLMGIFFLVCLDRSLAKPERFWGMGLALASVLYSIFLVLFLLPRLGSTAMFYWALPILHGAGMGLLLILDLRLNTFIPFVLTVLIAVITAIMAGRLPAYLYLLVTSLVRLAWLGIDTQFILIVAWDNIKIFLIAVPLVETTLHLNNVLSKQLARLNTINQVTRQLNSSLETEEVVQLISEALQQAIHADTYYVGMVEDDLLHLLLVYDDGKFFPSESVPKNEGVAGWVIEHGTSILLRNLPSELPRYGIELKIIGTERVSLSWMGTPLRIHDDVIGIVAIASYKLRSFDNADLELLENVARQASGALENSYHHRQVELRARMDSLTGVYNHGFFLEALEEQAIKARSNAHSLSLIMLDIDFFKSYNDRYGHLLGDDALALLVNNIRNHIKATDIVGRWGGEEFVIALPNAHLQQAYQVADRIRQAMDDFHLVTRSGEKIPAPTISQGIAMLPEECTDIYALIDLADKRLYVAKERGRNQIEPNPQQAQLIPPG